MKFIDYISSLSVLLPIIVGLCYWKRQKQKLFLGYLGIEALVDLIMFLMSIQGIRNIFVLNAFKVVQLGLVSYVVLSSFKKSTWAYLNKRISSLALSALGLGIISMVGWNEFSFGTYLFNQLIILALSSFGLIHVIKHYPTTKILGAAIFWVLIGFVFMFSLKTIIYVPRELAMSDESKENYFWFYTHFHPYVTILSNFIFAYSFWLEKNE